MIRRRLPFQFDFRPGAATAPVFLTLAFSVAVSGCASSRAPDASSALAAFEASNPDCEFERESRIALGGIKMSAVKALVKMAGASDEAEILSHMRRVEVVTYRVGPASSCDDLTSLHPFEDELVDRGWWPLVREREEDGLSLIFARGDAEGDLDGLFVIELTDDELEIVRLEGRIDRIMAEALAEDPGEVGNTLSFAR